MEANVHEAEPVNILDLGINPSISTRDNANSFRLDGRVQIFDFLEKSVADQIFQHLTTEIEWVLIFNRDEKRIDLDMETIGRMSQEKQMQMAHSIHP